MKKLLFILVTSILLVGCGSKTEKKKGFKYNRTQKEAPVKNVAAGKTAIDLSNKGIGPISSMEFDAKIDDKLVETGAAAFKQKCTACHMAERKLIGPAMKGIYERRNPAWVMNIILNPTEMLQKDPTAMSLLKEYNNIMMLNQNLT
jgi:mono/diheme cytochrome c family protein